MERKFTTEARVYNGNGTIDAEGATDIEFYNGGATTVIVNNRPILPNEWFQINGFPGEINTGKYQLNFATGTGSLTVTRRVYNK